MSSGREAYRIWGLSLTHTPETAEKQQTDRGIAAVTTPGRGTPTQDSRGGAKPIALFSLQKTAKQRARPIGVCSPMPELAPVTTAVRWARLLATDTHLTAHRHLPNHNALAP